MRCSRAVREEKVLDLRMAQVAEAVAHLMVAATAQEGIAGEMEAEVVVEAGVEVAVGVAETEIQMKKGRQSKLAAFFWF